MALGLPLLPMLLGLAGALPRAQAIQEVWQSPAYAISPEGGSINITCFSHGPLHGVYLKQGYWPKLADVIYYEDGREATVNEQFGGRITFSGPQHNLTITMHHLQPKDTGAYVCQAIMNDEVWGPGTLVVVTDRLSQAVNTCQEAWPIHFVLPVALAVGCFLIGLGLGAVCALSRTQVKKHSWAKDKSSVCVVYEDMSYRRHNTMSTPSQ